MPWVAVLAATHVSRILTALAVTNRVQAALVARDAGLTT
jgi:DNA-binding NarL/FixJ family response regulator